MRIVNEKQVEKEHYRFEKYSSIERFTDYFYQVKLMMKYEGKKVLYIGVGDDIVPSMVKKYNNMLPDKKKVNISSFDVDSELNPDIVGDIYEIDKIIDSNDFDCLCLFEVLEHFPKKDLNKLLQKLSKVTKKDIIISIPYVGITFNGFIKFPYLNKFNFLFKIPIYNKINHEEHFWEIGRKNMKKREFEKLLEKHFLIKDRFINKYQGSHIFYICRKK